MPQETREILFGDCKISIESAIKVEEFEEMDRKTKSYSRDIRSKAHMK